MAGSGRTTDWKTAWISHPALPVWGVRALLLPYRAGKALSVCLQPLARVPRWLLASRELSSWTYPLSPLNLLEACSAIAQLTGRPLAELLAYRDEVLGDAALHDHVRQATQSSRYAAISDAAFQPNRRLLMYLLVRARKPRLVVEAGVDKGLAALLVCRALARNRAEGQPGRYLGIDLHPPQRAFLFDSPWASEGRVVQGDAVACLAALDEPVDLYSHETVPDPTHTRAALAALWPRWAPGGLLFSPWTTDALVQALLGRADFLTVVESPVGHWYPGSRLLLARRQASPGPATAPADNAAAP